MDVEIKARNMMGVLESVEEAFRAFETSKPCRSTARVTRNTTVSTRNDITNSALRHEIW